jgi:5'-3' exonuclease
MLDTERSMLQTRRLLRCVIQKHVVRMNYRKFSTNELFTTADLPSDSTLYILDGTAMLFHAFHSKEHFLQHSNAILQEETAEKVRLSLSMDMDEYNNEMHIFRHTKLSTWDTNVVAGEKQLGNDLYCGALTVMALNFSRLIRDTNPKYIAIAFDTGKKSFRNELFASYKDNRVNPPIMMQPLFHLAPKVFQGLGANCFTMKGYEADDVMASLSRWGKQQGLSVVHVSSDKDMLQLVDSDVHVMQLNQKGGARSLMGLKQVHDKYEVPASLLVDYMSIVGDTADNIPGVRGIGPRLSLALLHAFGNIENMISKLNIPFEETVILDKDIPIVVANEPAIATLSNSFKELCVRATANKTIIKLYATGSKNLLLYKKLVCLVSDLPPEEMHYSDIETPFSIINVTRKLPDNSVLKISSSISKSLQMIQSMEVK